MSKTENNIRADEEKLWRIAPAFVMALALALRKRGVHLPLNDVAACAALVATREEWRRVDIEGVLIAALARRPENGLIIKQECALLFAPPLAVAAARPEGGLSREDFRPYLEVGNGTLTGETEVSDPSPGKYRIYILGGIAALVLVPLSLRFDLGQLASSLPSIAPNFLQPSDSGTPVATSTLVILASVAAVLAAIGVGLGLLVWRRVLMRRKNASVESNGLSERPRPKPLRLDDSVFRVGSVGGAPPRFLSKDMEAEIAEMIGYRLGGVDSDRLNVGATLAARLRNADSTTLIHALRKELPTILILVDTASEAKYWNTLANEFQAVLRRRGIAETRIDFSGSLFRSSGLANGKAPGAQRVLDLAAAPGWTITTVFGEAQRLGRRDRELYRQIAENGPLLFLDYRDVSLWDAHEAFLQAERLAIEPATGIGLRDGLARIFAPSMALTTVERIEPKPWHQPSSWHGAAESAEDVFDRVLGTTHRDWAEDCALVEPVSFALAEKLRLRDAKLFGTPPGLDFSRLAVLPGSWVGPEGLRFEAALRRKLLNDFAKRPIAKRRATMEIIDDAFALVQILPMGTSATIVKRYVQDSARLVALTSEEAWRSLDDLRVQKAMAAGLVESVFARLAPRGEKNQETPDGEGSETIVLGDHVETAEMHEQLFGPLPVGGLGAGQSSSPLTTARWRLGLPDARIVHRNPPARLGAALPSHPGPVPAAFLAGGRYMLLGDMAAPAEQSLHLVDTVAGDNRPITVDQVGGTLVRVVAARDALVAVALYSDGAIVVIPESILRGGTIAVNPHGTGSFNLSDNGPLDAAAIRIAVSVNGTYAALVLPGSGQMLCMRLDEGLNSARPRGLDYPARVTAVAAGGDGSILVGLENGQVWVVSAEELARSITASSQLESTSLSGPVGGARGPRFQLEAAPIALASWPGNPSSESPREILVAATDDGRLLLTDGEYRVEHETGYMTSRVALFSDRPPARQGGNESGFSVAVQEASGGFDIIGMPRPEAIPLFRPISILQGRIRPRARSQVLAFAAQTRRVAVLEGKRLAVRPLLYRPADEALIENKSSEATP